MRTTSFSASVLGLFLALMAAPLHGQESEIEPEDPLRPAISTQVNAVLLDVVVRDDRGRPVRDLRQEEIRVFEDNVEQQITGFRSRTDSGTPTASITSR